MGPLLCWDIHLCVEFLSLGRIGHCPAPGAPAMHMVWPGPVSIQHSSLPHPQALSFARRIGLLFGSNNLRELTASLPCGIWASI